MSRPPVRVFAQFKGLSEEGATQLREHFPHDYFEFSDGDMELEFEGAYFFADDFVDMAVPHLQPGGQGWLDVIDNHEWTVTRYHFTPEGCESRTLPIDGVLEKYHQE